MRRPRKPPIPDAQSSGSRRKKKQKINVPTNSSGYRVHRKNALFSLRFSDLFFFVTPPPYLCKADKRAHIASGVSQTM